MTLAQQQDLNDPTHFFEHHNNGKNPFESNFFKQNKPYDSNNFFEKHNSGKNSFASDFFTHPNESEDDFFASRNDV